MTGSVQVIGVGWPSNVASMNRSQASRSRVERRVEGPDGDVGREGGRRDVASAAASSNCHRLDR